MEDLINRIQTKLSEIQNVLSTIDHVIAIASYSYAVDGIRKTLPTGDIQKLVNQYRTAKTSLIQKCNELP